MSAAPEFDDIPITFTDCVRAHRWAIEALHGSSDYGGMYQQIIAHAGQPWRNRAEDQLPARRLSKFDILDLAHTISAIEVNFVPDVPRTIFRAVYCARLFPGVRSVAAMVVSQDVAAEVTRPKVRSVLPKIAHLAMDAEKKYRVWGQRTTKKAYADRLGVKKQALAYGGWGLAITAVQQRVRSLLDEAEGCLEAVLVERGIVKENAD